MNLKLSILIINWNSWHHLERSLGALGDVSPWNWEILVVDNASHDGSPEKIRDRFPWVKVKENAENLGHTGGFNQGVSLVEGEFVLLLDDDTEPTIDIIQGLLDYLEQHPNVDLVSPRLYHSDGRVQETARNFPSMMTGIFGRKSMLTRIFPNNPISRRYLMREKIDETRPYAVQAVSSACMLFRKALADEVDVWDEDYPGYWVDIDWCIRLHRHGKKVMCIPSIGMTHHETIKRGTKLAPRRLWIFHYGAYLLYRKHYTRGVLDPRAIFAFCALSARCGLLALAHMTLSGRATR